MGIKRWLKELVREDNADGALIKFSPAELSKATKKFSKRLGQGAFGEVFYGVVTIEQKKTEVAVKRMMETSDFVVEQFLIERELLGRFSHPNLVKLYGYSTDGRMLVYEFLPGGDVDTLLDNAIAGKVDLPWERRLDIALEAARGLAYLHENDFVHRDFKPTNVMMDGADRVKVTDLGLARRATDVKAAESGVVTRVMGTPLYLDPEYSDCGVLHPKSDVFSYGVFLTELIMGERVKQVDFNKLREKMKKDVSQHRRDFLDSKIVDQCEKPCLVRVALTAIQASSYDRDDRPTMAEIVQKLEEAKKMVSSVDLKVNGGLTQS